VAPIEVAGATRAHLPQGGDRQANLALHIIALTQVRMRASRGRASCNTKVAAGETHNEAMRCLKRKIADQSRGSCSPTIGDQRRTLGATLSSSAAGATPPLSLRLSHFQTRQRQPYR
jgi:transposase